jgi:predicted TIM-barrel fold metal-dependent hydrolase
MAKIPFVDTHVHFFDQKDPNLFYVWLQADWVHPILGDIDAIKSQRYWADDFIAESRFANVPKSIHVQAATGINDPVEETKWLQAFADRLGHPHGLVAEAQLAAPDVEDVIRRHTEYPNVRGVRDFGRGDYLLNPDWQRGFALLEKFDLVSCIDSTPANYGKVRLLAEKFPGITISLDHAGFPRARDDGYFQMWRNSIRDLAEAPNVAVKISGLGMCDPQWTVDSLRPWVLSCIEAFGPARSFFGTNWPIDRLRSSYPDIINAYAEIISDFSEDEQEAMFFRNAERLFRI